jgi:transcription initiation factor TFIIB
MCKSNTEIRYDYANGLIKCAGCGLVLDESFIDPSQKERTFKESNSGTDATRTGGARNENLADGGLSLSIAGGNTHDRLNQHATFMGSVEKKSIIEFHKLFTQWGNIMNSYKKVIQEAEDLCNTIVNSQKNLKGRSLESVAAAALYIASRIASVPLKPQDIEGYTQVNIKDIKSAYKSIKDLVHIPPLDPPSYCKSFCKKLSFQNEIAQAPIKISERIKELRLLDGKNPRTVAATAIYIAILLTPNPTKSLKDISDVSQIAENTIKNAYKEVYPRRNEVVHEWKGRLGLDALHN